MLTHHDGRSYVEAASDAARFARGIMEKKIAEGRVSAQALLERVHTFVPQDAVVRSRALEFADDPELGQLHVHYGDQVRSLHGHALGQLASKADIPTQYLRELAAGAPWQRGLAAHALNEHMHQGHDKERYLLRAVGHEVRGFLSDRYRRLDSRPLLETFAAGCAEVGAVPVDGVVSDTRVALKAFLPVVFEPVPNEVMCLGIEWGNSDFGSARHTVRAMIWRLWCTNKATLEDSLAQVHLGGRLSDDIEFSDRTYALDTRASVSALRDVVRGVLGPAKVGVLLETIKQADAKKVEWKNVKTALAKRLLKGEMQEVQAAFESEDVVNLPAGKTAWRASNAVSWIAGKAADPDRKLELERIAGEIVDGRRDAGAEVEAA